MRVILGLIVLVGLISCCYAAGAGVLDDEYGVAKRTPIDGHNVYCDVGGHNYSCSAYRYDVRYGRTREYVGEVRLFPTGCEDGVIDFRTEFDSCSYDEFLCPFANAVCVGESHWLVSYPDGVDGQGGTNKENKAEERYFGAHGQWDFSDVFDSDNGCYQPLPGNPAETTLSFEIDPNQETPECTIMAGHYTVDVSTGNFVESRDCVANSNHFKSCVTYDAIPVNNKAGTQYYWNVQFFDSQDPSDPCSPPEICPDGKPDCSHLTYTRSGYCIDPHRTLGRGCFTGKLVSSLDPYWESGDCYVDLPENLDSLNYLLNKKRDPLYTCGEYTQADFNWRIWQRAVWWLTDSSQVTSSLGAAITVAEREIVECLVEDALTNGDGFYPGCDDVFAVILVNVPNCECTDDALPPTYKSNKQEVVFEYSFAEFGCPCKAETVGETAMAFATPPGDCMEHSERDEDGNCLITGNGWKPYFYYCCEEVE